MKGEVPYPDCIVAVIGLPTSVVVGEMEITEDVGGFATVTVIGEDVPNIPVLLTSVTVTTKCHWPIAVNVPVLIFSGSALNWFVVATTE